MITQGIICGFEGDTNIIQKLHNFFYFKALERFHRDSAIVCCLYQLILLDSMFRSARFPIPSTVFPEGALQIDVNGCQACNVFCTATDSYQEGN